MVSGETGILVHTAGRTTQCLPFPSTCQPLLGLSASEMHLRHIHPKEVPVGSLVRLLFVSESHNRKDGLEAICEFWKCPCNHSLPWSTFAKAEPWESTTSSLLWGLFQQVSLMIFPPIPVGKKWAPSHINGWITWNHQAKRRGV